MQRINEELSRLDAEEEQAEELLLERQQQINEALARLARLHKMKKLLRTKGVEIIHWDLLLMEELEEEEYKEAEEKAQKEELERV